ncbi:MAG: ribosome small subunit-dependent GTPase A [[Eubacterium] siraeum]|nr:ribosome small subunit-dependent GTPase A [[Eubacterium] siraeum]
MKRNRIIGVSGGLFSVETENGTVQAASRGVFRQKGIKPVTGDFVQLKWEENSLPVINEVLDRKNMIVRPPLANLDTVILVVSSCEPAPNAFVLDKLTAVFESKGIETAFVFTKIDRRAAEDLGGIYSGIGYKTFMADNISGRGTEEIAAYIKGKTAALIGNSGVGKSSLMNYLVPDTEHKTSEVSKKLGRGRHTTREVRMYRPDKDTYIADTPGFSTVEVSKYVSVPSAEVADCFREIAPYTEKCRFKDCAHIKEDCCAVREALLAGKIARSRYDSYCRIYEEAVKKEREY